MYTNSSKQLGQVRRYIIIVAITIAAITVYNLFGDTVRGRGGWYGIRVGRWYG